MFIQEFNNQNNSSWLSIFAKVIFLLVILYFSSILVFSKSPWIFLDGVNLLIHESGHLVFAFAGETISYLGGTIMQLLVPSLFLTYFLRRTDVFSSGFCLFWVGDNLINISVYVKDAQLMAMPLVGGGNHDWNILLSKWHLLASSSLIGNVIYIFGILFLMAGLTLLVIVIVKDIKLMLEKEIGTKS